MDIVRAAQLICGLATGVLGLVIPFSKNGLHEIELSGCLAGNFNRRFDVVCGSWAAGDCRGLFTAKG